MKNLIISCVILALLLGALVFYGVYANNVTSELIGSCSGDGIYSIEAVKEMASYWESHRAVIHLGVNSALTDNLSLAFSEHLAALEAPSDDEKEKTAEALRFHLASLREASLVSWENVL